MECSAHVYFVSLYTFCVTTRHTPSLLKCSTKRYTWDSKFHTIYFSAPGHVGPASPPHPTPTTHKHTTQTHTTHPPHTPPPLRRLGGGASTSGLANLRTERREAGRTKGREEEEEDEGDEEGGTYPEGPGISPEGEGLLRDGAGRRGTGDGSEGAITVVSRDTVLGALAGLATEVSRAVW